MAPQLEESGVTVLPFVEFGVSGIFRSTSDWNFWVHR